MTIKQKNLVEAFTKQAAERRQTIETIAVNKRK